MPEAPICDFCASPDVRWRYRSEDFRSAIVAVDASSNISVSSAGSRGDWAACPACHALIESGDRARLVRRAVSRYLRSHPDTPVSRATLTAAISAVQSQFFDNRVGSAVPGNAAPQ